MPESWPAEIHADAREAFDGAAVGVGLILATHEALVFSEMLASTRADDLGTALQGNREIGVATGILMQRHHLTRQQAFDVRPWPARTRTASSRRSPSTSPTRAC